jgi:large subunit ribosomal protein L3
MRLARFLFFIHFMPALIGKKGRMTQVWKDGKIVPVTLVTVTPNTVSLVRTKERDGYEAVQVKTGRIKKEFKGEALEMSAELSVGAFQEGDTVRVSGTMKGRGFQGVVKRHNFGGGPQTHGQKNRLRAPGSIGSTAPQRVWKGRRMAGHMGTTRVTVRNLRIVAVDAEKNILMIKGALPGNKGSIVEIQKTK